MQTSSTLYLYRPNKIATLSGATSHIIADIIHISSRTVYKASKQSKYFIGTCHAMRDLSSLTRDRTQALAVKVLSPNHWTTREFPSFILYIWTFENFALKILKSRVKQ